MNNNHSNLESNYHDSINTNKNYNNNNNLGNSSKLIRQNSKISKNSSYSKSAKSQLVPVSKFFGGSSGQIIQKYQNISEEIDNYFAYEEYDAYPCGESCGIVEKRQRINADWMYDSKYYYWTMSIKDNLTNTIWKVTEYGGLGDMNVYYGSFYPGHVVRPVIVLDKSVL